jgi:hypothetical protein
LALVLVVRPRCAALTEFVQSANPSPLVEFETVKPFHQKSDAASQLVVVSPLPWTATKTETNNKYRLSLPARKQVDCTEQRYNRRRAVLNLFCGF